MLVACIFLGYFDHVQAELSDVEKDVVVKALNPDRNAQDMSCAYTETIHRHIPTDSEEEAPYETIVGRFDPILRPESPWQVLSIDGRIPTEEEAEYFQPAPFFHPVVHIGFGYSHIEDLSIVARHDETWEIENTVLEYVEIPKELTPKTPQIPKGATLTAPQEIKTTFHVHAPTASLMAVRVDVKNAMLPSSIVQTRSVYMYEEKVGSMVVKENSSEMLYFPENEEVQSIGSTRRVFSDFDCRDESPAEYQRETTRE